MVDSIDSLIDALASNSKTVLATLVGPASLPVSYLGRKMIVRENRERQGSFGVPMLDQRVEADCQTALTAPSFSRTITYALENDEAAGLGVAPGTELRIFVEALHPAESLLIVGAGHIAQPLCQMAKMLGFSVAVFDDRWSFANRERFPDADFVLTGYYHEELSRFPITPSTYIVLVTRGHVHDEQALRQVIHTEAAYIGMIGSKRRAGAVLQRLIEEGVPRAQVERICAPIGIDLGAETPEEIAVSILAEIINIRRRRTRNASSMSSIVKLLDDTAK